jgi:hypothetical protein
MCKSDINVVDLVPTPNNPENCSPNARWMTSLGTISSPTTTQTLDARNTLLQDHDIVSE